MAELQKLKPENLKRIVQKMLICGLALMVGGEIFCLRGPSNRPELIHVSCHTVFWIGVAVCVGAGVVHLRFNPNRKAP